MTHEYIAIEQSPALQGSVGVEGAKNAVLVIMASLILTAGKSRLYNVPASDDVFQMIRLLTDLGADIVFDIDNKLLQVDTTNLNNFIVCPEIVRKIRASILIMGPLLARFGKAQVAFPGGDLIGARPIDLHLKAFTLMGVAIEYTQEYLKASTSTSLRSIRFVLDYPSVGATENIIMAAVLTPGVTRLVNAALEPEVLDLITVLIKMGAQITLKNPMMIEIEGVTSLKPIEHTIMPDRLEVGTLLIATAITGGTITIADAPADCMEVFLAKLVDMGHDIVIGANGKDIQFRATPLPRAISFKTMPYPGFPTDLQAPMIAALCLADGISVVDETVYENRLLHVRELLKMGAQITVEGTRATIKGVDALYGASVIASDIRASAALIIAGLAAEGKTTMTGVHHVRRGYHGLEKKLAQLGGKISIVE